MCADTRSVICESDSDEADITPNVLKSTVCLVLNKVQRRFPDRMEEVERDTQVIYSEDLNPENINVRDIAKAILDEIPRLLEANRVRFVRGKL